VLLRCSEECNQEQFEASRHRTTSERKNLVIRMDDALTDERPDVIPRRPKGCKGTKLHCFESIQSLHEAHN
jgi:hypothetical protein